jgi:D-arabinose 1-dehydrogenase-like Zn-dependent alcohol dehydrogenase
MASVMKTAASAVFARATSRRRAIAFALRNGPAIWRRLLDLARKGALREHIARTVALEEVADALRAMDTGHGRGKIVVRVT